MKKRIIVFSIPIIVLLLMTIPLILTLSQGSDIVLETLPIDPDDLFRGEYISLNYEISDVDRNDLSEDLINHFDNEANDYSSIKVYSALQKSNDGYYKVKSVSSKKPDQDIYLKGSLYRYREYEEIPIGKDYDEDYEEKFKYIYHINYNIDKYFVPENTARDFERASEKGRLKALVKVYKGNALLKEIKIK